MRRAGAAAPPATCARPLSQRDAGGRDAACAWTRGVVRHACLARLRVAAPLNDADVAGTAGAAALGELPDALGEGAFNPALGALADEGGAFPD